VKPSKNQRNHSTKLKNDIQLTKKIADITEQLLQFFDPNFNDIRHMKYREENPYFELDYT